MLGSAIIVKKNHAANLKNEGKKVIEKSRYIPMT